MSGANHARHCQNARRKPAAGTKAGPTISVVEQTSNQHIGLPRFSLTAWRNAKDSAAAQQRLADELCTVCHKTGFFLLVDHGVDQTLIKSVFDLSARFFALPIAAKEGIDKRKSRHFRGWESEGSEYTNGRPDIREQIDLWSEHSARGADVAPDYLRLLGPNLWPEESLLPGFNKALNRWFCDLGSVADELMTVLSTFGSERMSLTKLISYPPTPAGQFGVNAHHDAGFLTLLSPGTHPGLQIEGPTGDWIDVPVVDGALVVNLGEILQSMSGNYLLATPHRVVTSSPRQSAAYFHGPSLDMSLAPIELADRFVEAVAASPRHQGAGFMARKQETESGVADMASHHRPDTYGDQLWNYFCRSYPENVALHYGKPEQGSG